MEENNNIETINPFLQGKDPMEKIISIECGYNDDEVNIICINSKGKKVVRKDDFKPFVWAKHSVCDRMFEGDRKTVKKKLNEFGIEVRLLRISNNESQEVNERLLNGYKYLFKAKRKMSYQKFQQFFQLAKTPIYERKKKGDTTSSNNSSKEFLAVTPVEQYMMSTGRRMFKGYDNYDELKRLLFDLETQGLNPEIHAIDQIGIRTNKGFEKVLVIEGNTDLEKKQNELTAIVEFLGILRDEKPDIIAGHNSEVFDWQFIETRCKVLGTSLEELSTKIIGFAHPIYKKKRETVLKLGGEVEYYKPTIIWGHNVLDSLHAVRRAQAIDSDMKSANLKYVTQYLGLKKQNRVYVQGQQIGTIWREREPIYAFNNTNGDYYKLSETKPLKEEYEAVSGKYIVERYLLDDIWETDKVELALNEANFLIGKLLPTTFQRACTMGTASIWKLIMLAWCYENNLAIPAFAPSKSFTGGLSRLLKVGYVDNVAKLDFNSLYPSITLTWNIKTDLDITNSMLMMLNYILTEREKYKGLKGEAGAKAKKLKEQITKAIKNNEPKEVIQELKEEKQKWEVAKASNDKKQLPLKILANSFFGSYGSPNIFPFGDVVCAERITTIGRMSLRLMISHFTSIGYTPIVGDSVTSDTPLFIKYDSSNMIDIVPISELINEGNIKVDELGREYDYSKKCYKVLCRSGWEDVKYIYRHKADKDIYRVEDGNTIVDVTQDHSLFDENKKEIKPTDINKDTKLEYYTKPLEFTSCKHTDIVRTTGKLLAQGWLDRIPLNILNSDKETSDMFLEGFNSIECKKELSKTALAGLLFLKKKI